MTRYQLWLTFGNLRELTLDRFYDAGMQRAAPFASSVP
jgi:hypothetical protein